jgi:YopT peptidase
MGITSLVVRLYIRHMAHAAKNWNGYQTASFSQALEPTNSIIGRHATSRDGICQALSQRWIVLHSQGSSLFNWLYDKNGRIDPAAVANVTFNQIEGEAPGVNQDAVSERYLFSHGLMRRTGIIQTADSNGFLGHARAFSEGSKAQGDIFTQLANAIVGSARKVSGFYVMIAIKGPGGGHCMAAYVGDDLAYFDPNFGEYWFPNRDNFAGWLRETSAPPYRFGGIHKTFQVREYAPKMGFVKEGHKIGRRTMHGDY